MENTPHTLLAALLPHVPFEGWTESLLHRIARQRGITNAELSIFFPHGISDVVRFFTEEQHKEAYAIWEALPLSSIPRIRDRIKTAIRLRLEHYAPMKNVIRQTVSFYSLPNRAPEAVRKLWQIADDIWFLAGDNATDWNYYSKRALLVAVYSSTLLAWLEDNSSNHQESLAFLDRRLEEVMKLQKLRFPGEQLPKKLLQLPVIRKLLK